MKGRIPNSYFNGFSNKKIKIGLVIGFYPVKVEELRESESLTGYDILVLQIK